MEGSSQEGLFLVILLSAIRLGTPLCLAALGGYCSERTGTVNIALEGMMLIGAFSAAAVALATQSAFAGIAAGVASAMLLSALHGLLCVKLKGEHIISGLAVNLLAAGLCPVIGKAFFGVSSGTPSLSQNMRVASFGGVSHLILLCFACAALVTLFHYKTRLGQYFRFAGEHPKALLSQGISVNKVRWTGVLLSGFFCGLAGAYLSIDHSSGFSRNMTAGRGFIALAALIVGRWNPLGAAAAAFLFGLVEASQIFLQGFQLPDGTNLPVQWIQIIPYAATLVLLAGFFGSKNRRIQPPRALGVALD
ncbi:MAG: ABC transporter permease [Bdellovibrionota bacterium]